MDILGKIYLDKIIRISDLDGKSHEIKDYSYGGLVNLLNDNNFISNNKFLNYIYFYCILYLIHFNNFLLTTNISPNHNLIHVNDMQSNPIAFIIESNFDRTSFVLNDDISVINEFQTNSNYCLIVSTNYEANYNLATPHVRHRKFSRDFESNCWSLINKKVIKNCPAKREVHLFKRTI